MEQCAKEFQPKVEDGKHLFTEFATRMFSSYQRLLEDFLKPEHDYEAVLSLVQGQSEKYCTLSNMVPLLEKSQNKASRALLEVVEKEIKGLAGRLGNPNFADKAPPEVVAECQANLAEKQAQADLARKRLADLS